MLLFVVFMIGIAILFDFLNGMHDAANSISTVVSTKVLSPRKALLWAAFFNFIACMVFGVSVAGTIGKGVVDQHIMDIFIIFSAMTSGIIWNAITIKIGIPSSSSHALVGGLLGAGLIKGGFHAIVWKGIGIICLFIFLSPLFGMIFSILTMISISWITVKMTPYSTKKTLQIGQLFSSALLSLAHGGNDAQKTMGIITIILFSQGYLTVFNVPFWVIMACQSAMGLGTLFGGMNVMNTMSKKITKLSTVQAFSSEAGCGFSLVVATLLGIPVSTTHTMTGAIIGSGISKNTKAVKWNNIIKIVFSWLITIPCAAIISGIIWYILYLFFNI